MLHRTSELDGGQKTVAGSRGHGNEPSGSIKGSGEFLD